MVGFKSLWPVLALILMGACVPQTKQTECSSNEAFNSSLRTCVPIVPGPSSFINITSVIPSAPLIKYKNDTIFTTVSISVSNPYAQSYTIVWERNYNGLVTPFTPTTPTSYTFMPSFFSSEVGTHVITARIIDSNNDIVDSHNFELRISENPKPSIVTASVSPAAYHSPYTPYSTALFYRFTVKNNTAIAGAGYRTDWSISRNGTQFYTESDSFPTTIPDTGDLLATGSNYPKVLFDPAALAISQGLGNYVIRAQVINSMAEVVAEQQWSATIAHPPLSVIQARDILAADPSVPYGTGSIAYNGVPYSQPIPNPVNPINFVPVGEVTQGDYCVRVLDGEGSYTGDGQYVKVDYYLNGSTLIYTGFTNVGVHRVCLSDASAPIKASILFNNVSTTTPQNHTITARVTDMRTGQEYTGTAADTQAGLGVYPFIWNFSVRPNNSAPGVAFVAPASSAASCTTITSTLQNCTVTQGQEFTVGLTVSDEFYTTFAADDNKFSYSFQLRRGAAPMSGALTSCTKASTDISQDRDAAGVTQGVSDFTGPHFICRLRVPNFDASNVPIHPSSLPFDIIATVSDTGSPIGGAPAATSVQMRWALNVTEDNTGAAAIAAFDKSNGYASVTASTTIYRSTGTLNPVAPDFEFNETDSLLFRVQVTDPQGDDFELTVSRYTCIESTASVTPSCTSKTPIYGPTYINNNAGAGAKRVEFNYSGTEELIGDPAACGTAGLPATCIRKVYFNVEVLEKPSTITVLTPLTMDIDQHLANVNPAPFLAGTATPATGPTLYSFSGFPLTLTAGALDDNSSVTSERNLSYGWYVRKTAGAYVVIPGANSTNLVWTANAALVDATDTINIKFCYTDGTNTYPLDPASARCSAPWTIVPWINTITPVAPTTPTGSIAITQDIADSRTYYTASVTGNDIVVNKSSVDTAAVLFDPYDKDWADIIVPGGTSTAVMSFVSDVSLATTADTILLASRSATSMSPGTINITVKNFDKSTTPQAKTSTSFVNQAKFGYNTNGITIDVSPPTGIDPVVASYAARGTAPDIDFSLSTIADGEHITINGVNITFNAAVGSTLSPANIVALEVCQLCGQNVWARQVSELINQSNIPEWQGITATWAGGGSTNVRIYGSLHTDYANVTVNSPGMGAIGVFSTNWYIPYINGSASNPDTNKISVLIGDVATAGNVINAVTTNENLTSTTPASGIASAMYNDRIYVATINQSGSTASLYRLDTSGTSVSVGASRAILSGLGAAGFDTIRISPPSASNLYVYVIARDTNGKWFFGRYDQSTLNPGLNDQFALSTKASPVTATLINDASACSPTCDVRDMQITTSHTSVEARILVTSDNTTPNAYKPYMIRAKFDTGSADWDLFCDHTTSVACHPVADMNMMNLKMAVSPRTVASGTIGSAGVVVGENNKPIVYAAFPRDAVTDDVVQMLINAKNEAINTTGIDSVNLLYRPAYVAD